MDTKELNNLIVRCQPNRADISLIEAKMAVLSLATAIVNLNAKVLDLPKAPTNLDSTLRGINLVVDEFAGRLTALESIAHADAEAMVRGAEPQPVVWEYLRYQESFIDGGASEMDRLRLNALGADGWELVAVDGNWNEHKMTYFFKRPRRDP